MNAAVVQSLAILENERSTLRRFQPSIPEPIEILVPPSVKPEPLTEDDETKLRIASETMHVTFSCHSSMQLTNLLFILPDVKIKKEECLDDLGIGSRLRALGPDGLDTFPISLDDDIKMARVTRI